MHEVRTRLETGGKNAAVEWINSQGAPLEVAALYSKLVKDFYNADRGAKILVIIGPPGVEYCLEKASEFAKADPAKSLELRGWAKTISYNIGSNTWPAWGDEGVTISPSEMAVGLEAAKANLRFAIELEKPEDKVSMAHWLLGAHWLAAGEHAAAISEFEMAAKFSRDVQDPGNTALNEGFVGIAELISKRDRTKLDRALAELGKIGTEDSGFFIQQLETALKYFTRA